MNSEATMVITQYLLREWAAQIREGTFLDATAVPLSDGRTDDHTEKIC